MELIMRYVAYAALLAGTLVATPAFAQEVPNNGGFHVDGIVGWDHARASGETANGVAYGAGVGYDLQSGRALFGVEAEASDSSADRCITGSVIAGDRACASFGRDLYAGGRVGYLVGPRTLIYAKAGYTNARASLSYDDGTAATNLDFVDHRNLDGIRAGAGLQFGIGDHAYVRTEYRYSNYQDGVDRHQVVGGFGVHF
jgi:outer membrane immunogenic protein